MSLVARDSQGKLSDCGRPRATSEICRARSILRALRSFRTKCRRCRTIAFARSGFGTDRIADDRTSSGESDADAMPLQSALTTTSEPTAPSLRCGVRRAVFEVAHGATCVRDGLMSVTIGKPTIRSQTTQCRSDRANDVANDLRQIRTISHHRTNHLENRTGARRDVCEGRDGDDRAGRTKSDR